MNRRELLAAAIAAPLAGLGKPEPEYRCKVTFQQHLQDRIEQSFDSLYDAEKERVAFLALMRKVGGNAHVSFTVITGRVEA